MSYSIRCPTTAPWCLDGRDSSGGALSWPFSDDWQPLGRGISSVWAICVVLGRAGLESSRGWDSLDTRGHCLPGWWDGANCCQHIRLKSTSVVEKKKKKSRWCLHCLGEFVQTNRSLRWWVLMGGRAHQEVQLHGFPLVITDADDSSVSL